MRRPLFTFPIPSDTLTSLLKAGYKSYEDLFSTASKTEPSNEVVQILENTGFSWNQFKKVINPQPRVTAAQILKGERICETIPTFSEAVDDILAGGVSVGHLIQLCGPPGSGKTQLLMQLCMGVQIPVSMGGLNSSAIFIDSERGFTKHRLLEIAEATVDHCKCIGEMYNLTEDIQDLFVEKFLNGVKYMEVTGHVELLASLSLLPECIIQNKVKLIILDSIVMCLLGLTNNLDRTRFLTRVIKQLREIAIQHSVAVVVVNDLTTWISHTGEKVLLPSLGESASHLFPTIILLAKHAQYFSALVHKSSSQPRRIANFIVLKEGIRDLRSTS